MSVFSVTNWLAQDSPLARRLENYEYRPQQIQMANAVAKALNDKRHLIVEAGTGLGKTLAYLIPAIIHSANHNSRIIVSTFTINLQEQIINKDIPLLTSVIPAECSVVLVKGRGNYLCLRRLARAISRAESLFVESQTANLMQKIRKWAATTDDGSVSDLPFYVPSGIWSQISGEHGNCLGKRCVFFDRCHYWRARRRMQHANILITNHALLCSDLSAHLQGLSLLGKYDIAIIDEAQNLDNVASEHFGLYLSQAQFFSQLNNLYNPKNNKGLLTCFEAKDTIKALERTARTAKAFFDHIRDMYHQSNDSNFNPPPNAIHNELSVSLHELADELKRLRGQLKDEEDRFDITMFREKFLELANQLENFVSQSKDDYTYWIEADRNTENPARDIVVLRAAPINVGQYLRESLFDRLSSVVLTSATLSVGGDTGFTYIANRLGLDDYDEMIIESPFDYYNQVTLYIEKSLPAPSEGENFLQAACEAIKKYLIKSSGRAFVLFTSYQMMYRAADLIKDFCNEHNFNLFVQGQDSSIQRFDLLETFKNTERAVLFGTDSFWQGVDVVGEALSNVIIVKLPFAVPDRPLIKARINQINKQGGNAFLDFQLPEAILKFKQGFGRLIRSKTDTGIVAVLDNRIITKSYGRSFLNALPRVKTVISVC